MDPEVAQGSPERFLDLPGLGLEDHAVPSDAASIVGTAQHRETPLSTPLPDLSVDLCDDCHRC